jgi:hypothetical protein
MAEQQKAKAKGRKIGRNKKHQAALYKSGARYDINKKRKMRRHIRNFPNDAEAVIHLRRLFPGNIDLKPTARGKRRLQLAVAREKLRA